MWISDILKQSWLILLDSAAYVLFGFVVAAFMHRLLARGFFVDALRKPGARSVWLATLIGGPLDLCSCSVLPAALALHRRGVSKGATIAFLISTPELSFSAFMLTYALLGGWMAVIRPAAACLTALVAGLAQNWLEARVVARPMPADAPVPESAAACGTDCCDHDALSELEKPQKPPTLREGFRYAFVDIFDDVFGWLLVGILAAGIIQAVVPQDLLLQVLGNPWVAMLVLAAIGIPMYVCAEASTPIAAAFIAKGVAPGAGLVFLLCGPATNIGSILLLSRQLGRLPVAVYLASIAIVAIGIGAVVNLISPTLPLVSLPVGASGGWMPEWARLAGVVAFLIMCWMSAMRRAYPQKCLDVLNRILPRPLSMRAARGLAIAAIVVVYLLSGFAVVEADETGMVRRFGKLTRESAPPGLYYVGPWPVGRMDRVRVGRVQRLLLGESSGTPATIDERTGWMWLGDQNVASLVYAVHWSVRPDAARTYAYGVADAEQVVRVAVMAAMRETLSTHTIDRIYTTDRLAVEQAAAQRAQAHCDRAGAGIRIAGLRFQSVHAPAEVHEAFRDVASALEDRATRIDQALAEQARVIPLARGNAAATLAAAESEAVSLLATARGEANAFTEMTAAARSREEVTRTRLRIDMLDRVLPGARKYLRLDESTLRPMELWLRGQPAEPGGNTPPAP